MKDVGGRQFGMQTLLQGLYIHRDLMFFDLAITNLSHIAFDIDLIRWKVVDKKVTKRTAQQETFLDPVRSFNEVTRIDGQHTERAIFAFGKITLPDDKVLQVEIYEKGGGRHQRFTIENSDLISARPLDELKMR